MSHTYTQCVNIFICQICPSIWEHFEQKTIVLLGSDYQSFATISILNVSHIHACIWNMKNYPTALSVKMTVNRQIIHHSTSSVESKTVKCIMPMVFYPPPPIGAKNEKWIPLWRNLINLSNRLPWASGQNFNVPPHTLDLQWNCILCGTGRMMRVAWWQSEKKIWTGGEWWCC